MWNVSRHTIRASERFEKQLVWPLVLVIAALFLMVSPRAEALQYNVKGGFGFAEASVWCAPNKPPAAADYYEKNNGLFPTVHFGPGLPGCNPVTEVGMSYRFLGFAETRTARGGDSVDDPSLLSLVRRVSPHATGATVVGGEVTSPTSALFTILWYGSDAGVATRISWYEGSRLIQEI